MNKIQRIVFTMACLLTSLGGYSYKIVSMGSYPVDKCTVTATYNSNNVIAGTTDIPASNSNNVTIHISNITPGYYLDRIEYEYVTDLGQAEAPRRASGPGIQTKDTIPHNSSHITHYAGDYGLAMPASDIIITAILQECISINTYSLTLDGTATSLVYNGAYHTVTLKNGETTLVKGTEYGITTGNETYTNVSSNEVTLTGWGRYNGIRSATLSITAKTLTIITDDGQSKVYGASDPVFTYTYSGLCSDDQITGALGRAAGENAGSYAINIGDLTAGSNYNIAFTPKNFVINAKDLTSIELTITLDHDFFNNNDEVHKAEISTITYGSTPLIKGTDFSSTYAYGTGVYGFTDYITPDIYPITVTFWGNYTGSKTVEYQIRPKVTLNSSYRWMTYLEPVYNMEIPNSYKFSAHTVSGISTTSVTLTDRTQIRANVPMLLYRTGTTEETVFYPPLIKTPTDSWSGLYANYLWNSTEKAINTLISEHSNMDIWILVNDQFVRTKSGTLPANRGYLLKEKATGGGSSAPAMLPLVRGSENTTGVELIINNPIDNGDWYTLDGRKLQGRPTQKGVYINQGKKIYIK